MSQPRTTPDLPPRVSDSSPLLPLVDAYVRYYATGPSHTARAKRLDLQHFIRFLLKHRGRSTAEKLSVSDWTHESVTRFIDDLLKSGARPSTVSRRLATLKHLGRVLTERVPGFTNAARDVKTPRVAPLAPKSLTAEQLSQVRARARARRSEKPTFIRLRNLTLFELLLDTGIRADEARLLTLGQLDESGEWLKDVLTKGRRYRNVYITSSMRQPLQEYLDARQKELVRFFPKISRKSSNSLPLFISTYGAKADSLESFRMGAKSIWRAMHEISVDVGLHPHLFRHSFASELLDHTGDIRLVAQALGHSDIRITMRYTERTDTDVASALEDTRKRRKRE